jgi:plasmid stabilization system protein ParE
MPRTVRVLRAAAEEARAAWRWYREQSPDAADGFIQEYERAIARIGEAPGRWPAHVDDTRRLNLRRFP